LPRLAVLLVAALVVGAGPCFGAGAAKGSGGKGSGGGGASLVAQSGSVELGLKGLVDLDNDDETAAYADLALGYFFTQGIELGLTVLQGTTRDGQRDTFGAFGEYDLVRGSRFIPFLGLAGKHAAPPRGSDDTDAKIAAVYGGCMLALGPDAALSATAQWEMADHAVLGPEGARKRRNRDVSLGLRLYL
jgi:hypothetical protein